MSKSRELAAAVSTGRKRRRAAGVLQGVLILGGLGLMPFVQAGQQELPFRLVTRALDVKTEKIAEIEGQAVSTGRYAGTAIFEDGRIANKEFTFSYDLKGGVGPFYGYSTYAFADGSTLVMRFEGELAAGKSMYGEYTVLSGTGLYKDASGSGHFEKVDEPWKNANLYKGSLTITTP